VTEAARFVLVKHGYDPVYGARPLRRTVQRMLDDMLVESILRGELVVGDGVVDVVEGKLMVSRIVDQESVSVKLGNGSREAA